MRIGIAIAALLLAALPAQAQDATQADPEKKGHTGRWYAGVEGGLGVFNGFDLPGGGDTGFEVGGAANLRAGHQWRDHIRFDGVMTWQGADAGDLAGRIDLLTATANAYYDFADPGAFIRPYIGVGVGIAGGWLHGGAFDESGVGFAYLISGGGRLRINDDWTASAAWQFLGTAALIEVGGESIDPTGHGFMVGLHRHF